MRNDWAYRIVTCDDDMWKEMQSAGAEVLARHNKWIAYVLKQLFLRPSANTSAFEALVLNEAVLDRQIDGRWLWFRMQQPVIALTGQAERDKFLHVPGRDVPAARGKRGRELCACGHHDL